MKHIEKKWQKKWSENKVFESSPDKRKKFFVTFPYPYMNAVPHIGHFYTLMRVEAFARYKRMKGFNVLFPQGWHCTGSPIVSAAKRVEEGEKKQIKLLKDQGFSKKEINELKIPENWTKVFPKFWEKAYSIMGISYDTRRSFITTSLNPCYDKFIQWQFNKLKDKGYVAKGKHPVVWDPKINMPAGDHDRIEGEGEVPQEFTLLKFKLDGLFVIAATLRPETVFGQTNLWINPELDYVKTKVDNEIWIVSRECAEKLKEQDRKVKIISNVRGMDLIGKFVFAPGIKREIIVLPSSFCDPTIGTGIVTSVPSDSPDDYIGLRDLWNDKSETKKYGLDYEKVKSIEIIPIIDSKESGDKAAVKAVEEMGIKNQKERDKLEKAKKLVYKKGYYEGVMNKNCGIYAGLPVEKAKEIVKKDLIENGDADVFYELTGKVVSRSLTECVVKIVSDQWFIKYGDMKWKKKVHEALKEIRLYPEDVRDQFSYVIDWLNDWACTREYGLGTRMPFDEKWVIESLSDSTIYMAYYTFAHLIKKVPHEKINEKFFDYVILNKGIKPKIKNVDKMKKEFEYWYPVDFRNSGKDLVQNHLAFFIFNHTAVFPKDKWPKSIGVNGWVRVDGQKMSKSLGNMIPLIKMAEKYGADASRITILNGGESLDDPNWDSSFAEKINGKLKLLTKFCVNNYNKGRSDRNSTDMWMESELNSVIKDTTKFMEKTMFRSAIQRGYFDLQRTIKHYISKGKPNKKIMNKAIETHILLLSPFAPHMCEEIWSRIGKKKFICLSEWPEFEEKKINKKLHVKEEFVHSTINDIKEIQKLIKIKKPSRIILYLASPWKYKFVYKFKREFEKTRNVGDLIKILMNKEHAKEVQKMVPVYVKNPSKLPQEIFSNDEEFEVLNDNKKYIESVFGCGVEIIRKDNGKAMPGKAAILIE